MIDADDEAFDDDVVAVCASLAKRLFARVRALRRALECADDGDAGYLSVDAFASAVAAAGFGPRTFGPDEARWALARVITRSRKTRSVSKFLALVVVATERGVSARGRRRRHGTRQASRARCGRRAATRVGRGHGARRLRNGGRGGDASETSICARNIPPSRDGRRTSRDETRRIARASREGW